MAFLVEVTWPQNVANVKVDNKSVAAGELVSCDSELGITWSESGRDEYAYGQIEQKSGVVQWSNGGTIPVRVELVAIVSQKLDGRYRRRATEVARWELPKENESTNRWLIHPGAMTGDLWHIVAALHFDPNLKLVVVWNLKNDRDHNNATALLDLVKSLGLNDDRVLRVAQSMLPQQSIGNDVARREGATRELKGRGPTLVGHTWASTSIVVSQTFARGRCELAQVSSVQKALSDVFTAACEKSEEFKKNKIMYETYALSWLAGLKEGTHYVLVNMRWTGPQGQNWQHDITKDRFAQIVDSSTALTKAGRTTEVIRIGRPELLGQGNCGWAKDYASTTGVDLFCDDEKAAPPGLSQVIWKNKLFQAYFWQQVAKSRKKVSLIGGRSGGMDIASFMGIRSASWDVPSANDLHYLRLHWAAPYNSIIRIRDQKGPLDKGALEYWMLDRDLVPLIDNDPITGTVVDTKEQYSNNTQAFNALWYPPYPGRSR